MRKRKIVDDAPAPAPPPPEISHPFHPGHKLKLVTVDDTVFDCDGCKQPGKGTWYTCELHDGEGGCCDFDLHTCCALAEDVLQEHALFEGRAFVLLHEPPPADPPPRRICDACGDAVLGFVYHCFDHDLDIHPCCARLPRQISLDGITFELCNKKAPRRCSFCPAKGDHRCRCKFWSYRSDDCDGEAVSLHVACVKDMAHKSLKAREEDKTVLLAREPVLKGALQKRAKTSTKVKRFAKIVGILVRVIIGAIFGDPTAMVVAVAGLIFNTG